MTLITTAGLTAIRDAADRNRYTGQVPHAGWGSVADDPSIIGQVGSGRFRGGKSVVLEEGERAPERFVARYYSDQLDKKIMRAIGDGAEPQSIYALQAADIIITSSVDQERHLVLATSANDAFLGNDVVPALVGLAAAAGDDSARVLRDDSVAHLGDDDFFLWLLYRRTNDPQLTPAITLTALRSISSADPFDRAAKLTKGADLDRPELLALVSGTAIRFGPARFAFTDSSLDLAGEVELHMDGMFTPLLGVTFYDDRLDRAALGPRVVDDLAFKVIPDIRAAYYADSEWPKKHRNAFTMGSRSTLADKLMPEGCPHCGNALGQP